MIDLLIAGFTALVIVNALQDLMPDFSKEAPPVRYPRALAWLFVVGAIAWIIVIVRHSFG